MKINIHNTKFTISAVNSNQFPKDNLPEIVFVGRSNVGKSSILNALLNSATISSAITSLGLSKGGNYKRFIKIANDNKLYHLLVNINEKILTDEIYEELVKIDYSKFGWVSKAAKIIGISPQKARKWIERKCPELIEQSFSRNK